MSRPTLALGDPADPLMQLWARAAAGRWLLASPAAVQMSFRVDTYGRVIQGCFLLKDQLLAWDDLAGVVVRPSRAFGQRHVFRSVAEGLVFHERRTAWCAALAAFPGPVVSRLPASWFHDSAVHGWVQAHALAAELECPVSVARTLRPTVVIVVDGRVRQVDAGASRSFARWLGARRERVAAWQREAGAPLVEVRAAQDGQGWALSSVDVVPRLRAAEPALLRSVGHALERVVRR